jgi:hypothetical protein
MSETQLGVKSRRGIMREVPETVQEILGSNHPAPVSAAHQSAGGKQRLAAS